MPYLLPEGEPYIDDYWCYMVFVPADEAYRRAFVGSILGLEVWNIWERNESHGGLDAARAWKDANELTLSCLDDTMICLDSLYEELVAIRLLLSQQRDCCDIPFIYLPEEETDPPAIDPGVGDPPDEWGDGEIITTWEDWEGYVCYYANVYVDNLLGMADSLTLYAQLGAFAIMAIAGLLAVGAALGFIIAVSYPAAAGIVSGLLLGATTITFLDTRDELEAARDDIVCSIMQNTGLADAIEDALGSGLAWDLFFQFLNYNLALETIYTGEYDGEYLEALTDETCVCLPPGSFDITFTWDSDLETWTPVVTGGATAEWANFGNPAGSGHLRSNNQTTAYLNLTGQLLIDLMSWSGVTSITINELHFQDYPEFSFSGSILPTVVTANQSHSGWTDVSWWDRDYTGLDETLVNMGATLIQLNDVANSSTYKSHWIDNVRIVGSYDTS